jgi:lipoate-protein ligase A
MRQGGGILQHGSILIEPRIDKLAKCLRLPHNSAASTSPDGSARIEDGVAGLAEVGVTQTAQIAAAIAQAFAARFGVSLVEALLRPDELAAARTLAGTKYQSAGWTEGLAPAAARNTTRTR